MIWNAELAVAAVDRDTEPQLVGLNEWEDLFVGNRVLVPKDQKLLPVFEELRDVFAKEGKRRVGHYDVSLLEQLDTLGAAEVAALRERSAGVRVLLKE